MDLAGLDEHLGEVGLDEAGRDRVDADVLRAELAPRRIRVNAIAPGLVVTPLTQPAMDIPGIEDDYLENTPLGRSGRPDEIAAAALYLASAEWVTGEVLDINGGAHLMRYPDLNRHVLAAFS